MEDSAKFFQPGLFMGGQAAQPQSQPLEKWLQGEARP